MTGLFVTFFYFINVAQVGVLFFEKDFKDVILDLNTRVYLGEWKNI